MSAFGTKQTLVNDRFHPSQIESLVITSKLLLFHFVMLLTSTKDIG